MLDFRIQGIVGLEYLQGLVIQRFRSCSLQGVQDKFSLMTGSIMCSACHHSKEDLDNYSSAFVSSCFAFSCAFLAGQGEVNP